MSKITAIKYDLLRKYFKGTKRQLRKLKSARLYLSNSLNEEKTHTYGECYMYDKKIYINPILLHRSVPQWVLESVVWHELMHLMDPSVDKGIHSPLHCRLCFNYRGYYRFDGWLDDNAPEMRLLSLKNFIKYGKD